MTYVTPRLSSPSDRNTRIAECKEQMRLQYTDVAQFIIDKLRIHATPLFVGRQVELVVENDEFSIGIPYIQFSKETGQASSDRLVVHLLPTELDAAKLAKAFQSETERRLAYSSEPDYRLDLDSVIGSIRVWRKGRGVESLGWLTFRGEGKLKASLAYLFYGEV